MTVVNSINVQQSSLILEGGTFRTLFTAGVLDAFLDHEIMMPYILGISAGAINAASYVSKQKERTKRVIIDYRHDKRYMGWGNFLKEKSFFGLDFSYNVIPNQLDLFDWETFRNYDGTVLFGVTNALTGEIEYKNAIEMDTRCMMLRASCAIPILFPEIKLDDVPYYDGGLSEPIPIRKAMADGRDKHVIVLTQPKGYRKTLDKKTKWTMKLLKPRYPKLVESMEKRIDKYNETLDYCEKLEQQGNAFILRPDYAINSFEKDTQVMHQTHQMGYQQGHARIPELKDFLNSSI